MSQSRVQFLAKARRAFAALITSACDDDVACDVLLAELGDELYDGDATLLDVDALVRHPATCRAVEALARHIIDVAARAREKDSKKLAVKSTSN